MAGGRCVRRLLPEMGQIFSDSRVAYEMTHED